VEIKHVKTVVHYQHAYQCA